MIPTRKLSNGVEMPYLGFGTWKLKGEECSQMVKYALDTGYTAIDTAQVYLNEEAVGEGIRRSGRKREEFFVTSKVRNRFQGYDNTLYAVEASLKRFGLEQLDLFLVHWPGEDMYVPTWKALVRMYEEGLLRAVGASNFLSEHLETCAQETGVMPLVDQSRCILIFSRTRSLNTAEVMISFRLRGVRLWQGERAERTQRLQKPVRQEYN